MRIMALAYMAAVAAYPADSPHRQQLARLSGNKVLLLGPWEAKEQAAWEHLLSEQSLFSANIQVLSATRWSDKVMGDPDPMGFEGWVKEFYGVGASRWVLLDARNRLLASGAEVPGPDELRDQLARSGFQNPLVQLKAFLGAHPDHLEARADLLKEARRRALKLCAQYKDDPTQEHEITSWATLAQAVEDLFRAEWRGLQLPFFTPASAPPEAQSPTMKAVFARHIGKVEAARSPGA